MVSFSVDDAVIILRRRSNLLKFMRRTFASFISMLDLPETPSKKSSRLSHDKKTEADAIAENLQQLKLDVEHEKKDDPKEAEEQDDATNEDSTVTNNFFEKEDESTISTDIVALDSLRYSGVSDFTEVNFGFKNCMHAIRVLCDSFPDICDGGVVFRLREDDNRLLFKLFDPAVDDGDFEAVDDFF